MTLLSKKEKRVVISIVGALLFTEGLFQLIEPFQVPPIGMAFVGLLILLVYH